MARVTPVRAEELSAALWRTSVTIRFGECDPAGIVYTPVYFDLFNKAVEAWHIECLRLDYYDIVGPRRVGLGYGHVSADFFKPSFMGDVLSTAVKMDRIGRASFALALHMLKGKDEVARGHLVIVTTSLTEHKAIPIPADIRAALEAYRDRTA
jgi:4-hydroxybenzoyl-CoA thioesterase/acyl-CoA thioester hydrolase